MSRKHRSPRIRQTAAAPRFEGVSLLRINGDSNPYLNFDVPIETTVDNLADMDTFDPFAAHIDSVPDKATFVNEQGDLKIQDAKSHLESAGFSTEVRTDPETGNDNLTVLVPDDMLVGVDDTVTGVVLPPSHPSREAPLEYRLELPFEHGTLIPGEDFFEGRSGSTLTGGENVSIVGPGVIGGNPNEPISDPDPGENGGENGGVIIDPGPEESEGLSALEIGGGLAVIGGGAYLLRKRGGL